MGLLVETSSFKFSSREKTLAEEQPQQETNESVTENIAVKKKSKTPTLTMSKNSLNDARSPINAISEGSEIKGLI